MATIDTRSVQGRLSLFAGHRPVASGERVHRGDKLNAFVDPGSYKYVTIRVGARVVEHVDRASGVRVQLKPLIVDEAPFRLHAGFSNSPRGRPLYESSIELKVE
jgi:hypothetical protein